MIYNRKDEKVLRRKINIILIKEDTKYSINII